MDADQSFVQQIHRLRELLDSPELGNFSPIPLPVDPDVKIKGMVIGTSEDSKSSLLSIFVLFVCSFVNQLCL